LLGKKGYVVVVVVLQCRFQVYFFGLTHLKPNPNQEGVALFGTGFMIEMALFTLRLG